MGVPLVASAFTLSLPGPLLELRRCLLHRGGLTYLEVAGFCVTLVASALTLTGMARIWDVDVLHLQLASIPVWASLVLTATTFCRGLAGHLPTGAEALPRTSDAPGTRTPFGPESCWTGSTPVSGPTSAEVRRRAISTLRDRGLLTLEQAVQLSDLPLGQSMSLSGSAARFD